MNPISTVNPLTVPQPPSTVNQAQPGQGSFKDAMLESLDKVNSMQQDADQAVEKLMTGGDANPAEVLTAVQKADLAFRTMLQIRNKLVEAFDEVRNIRV